MAPERYLFVCTANICRSPMAEALLRAEAGVRGVRAEFASAGVRAGVNWPAADGSLEAIGALGHDLSRHRSRALNLRLADAADLIITMEARHVIDVVAGHPDRFRKTFTLREIVSRARRLGPRRDRPLAEWLDELGDGRQAADLMRAQDLDVVDPYGGSAAEYRTCASDLDALVAELARCLWGPPPTA